MIAEERLHPKSKEIYNIKGIPHIMMSIRFADDTVLTHLGNTFTFQQILTSEYIGTLDTRQYWEDLEGGVWWVSYINWDTQSILLLKVHEVNQQHEKRRCTFSEFLNLFTLIRKSPNQGDAASTEKLLPTVPGKENLILAPNMVFKNKHTGTLAIVLQVESKALVFASHYKKIINHERINVDSFYRHYEYVKSDGIVNPAHWPDYNFTEDADLDRLNSITKDMCRGG